METVFQCLIPVVLVSIYVWVCFAQLHTRYYRRTSFLFIQVYYISIIMGWLVSSYMPVTAEFPNPDLPTELQDEQRRLVESFYMFNHLFSCLVPEFSICLLVYQFYLQQTGDPQPQKRTLIFVGAFGGYILATVLFNGACSFGYGRKLCGESWFQYVSILLDTLPIFLSIVLLVLTIREINAQMRNEYIVDSALHAASAQVPRILWIVGMRGAAALLMVGWNVVLTFCADFEYKTLTDNALELVYKTLCGAVFLVKVRW